MVIFSLNNIYFCFILMDHETICILFIFCSLKIQIFDCKSLSSTVFTFSWRPPPLLPKKHPILWGTSGWYNKFVFTSLCDDRIFYRGSYTSKADNPPSKIVVARNKYIIVLKTVPRRHVTL